MNSAPTYNLDLPWSLSNDDAKFKKILIVLLVIYLFIALPIIFIKLPELTRAEKEQLPPQLARIMLEKQELPTPNLIEPIEQPQPETIKPEVKKPEEKKLQAKPPQERPVTQRPVERVTLPVDNSVKNAEQIKTAAVAQAREQAANSGLMQFKDDLADMRDSLQTSAVETAQANIAAGAAGPAASGQVDRSLINSGVNKGSGGVNPAAYSRDTGGTALSGRAATKVKSDLADASKKAAGATVAGGSNSDGSGGAARSEEEVRSVMERHKSALLNIYNKALRDDATLQGEVRVKLVIDPNGRIVDATIVSSALNNPELEAKLLQRIKLITFDPANVIRTTLNYSFNFVPQ